MNPEEPNREKSGVVMIVEDSPTQAALLQHLLEVNGYRVIVATCGKEALELLGEEKPGLIISDIVMPEMNGYELTNSIKESAEFREIPVILLTSLSDPDDILKGLDAKVDSYLTKPWDDQFLLDKVAATLESKPEPVDERDLKEVQVSFRGQNRAVNLSPSHALNLLFSTYENAVMINSKLLDTQLELKALNKNLENEIVVRKKAEEEVRKFNEELEQRVAERTEALERSNRELREFAYVVSHDLKAPLRAVSQLAGWLWEDYKDSLGEQGEKMIKMLQSRLDRMHGLIEGILEYSRLGRVKEKESVVDFNKVVKEVTDLIAPPAHIKVHVENQLPITNYERTRAEQLIQNLLGNAVKFCDKEEGLITISCDNNESNWTISVADNGPGIDPKYHKKIFQIFQTLAPRDTFESTGIGLSLVKKIVDMHGGEIWVESEEGKGAVFNFTIPKGQAGIAQQ